MKKNNLLKILGIIFLVTVVLSWIIPIGGYSNGNYIQGKISPLGLLDIIRIPLVTIANYIHYAIYFVLIGGLYGILNKTGAYAKIINGVAKKFKEKENRFLIISIIGLSILSSLTGLNLVLFILVPFIITVILTLNYSKVVAFLSTIGALLVGVMGSTYGFNISGYINFYFSLGVHADIISKFIILAIFTYMLIMFTIKIGKKDLASKPKAKEKQEILLFENKTKKEKSTMPIIVMIAILMIVLLIGMYNFQIVFSNDFFENMFNSIMSYEINGFPIIRNLIGNIGLIGYWNIYEISMIILLFTILIAWIYGLKAKDAFEGFLKGAKDIAPTAFVVMIVFIVYSAFTTPVNGQNMFYTISNGLLSLGNNINYVLYAIFTGFGSFVYSDFTYFFGSNANNITTIYTDPTTYPVLGLISQMVHGLVGFIAPTSLLLVAGLTYLKIDYKEWLKVIWKFSLQILVVSAVIIIVMAILTSNFS